MSIMLGVDYYGISVIIAAIASGGAVLIGAWNNRKIANVHNDVQTANGETRTPGELLSAVADQVGVTPEPTPPPPPAH